MILIIQTNLFDASLHESYLDKAGISSNSSGVFLYTVELSHENVANEKSPALSTGAGTLRLKSAI